MTDLIMCVLTAIYVFATWKILKSNEKSANAAAESTKIAQEQIEISMKMQQIEIDAMLLDHRTKVYNQLSEWLGYASVICNGNVHFSYSLNRFYNMVLLKTNYAPLENISFNAKEIGNIMIRLDMEEKTILLYESLFNDFTAEESLLIKQFLKAFKDMILHIDEEIGMQECPFYYANKLRRATVDVHEKGIIDKMQKEMKVVYSF